MCLKPSATFCRTYRSCWVTSQWCVSQFHSKMCPLLTDMWVQWFTVALHLLLPTLQPCWQLKSHMLLNFPQEVVSCERPRWGLREDTEAAPCSVVSMSQFVSAYDSCLFWPRQQYCTCLVELLSRCWFPTGSFVWLLKGQLQDNAWDNVTYAVIIRDQCTAVIWVWKNKKHVFEKWSVVVGAGRHHPNTPKRNRTRTELVTCGQHFKNSKQLRIICWIFSPYLAHISHFRLLLDW